jgi:hypothetical protein
MKLFSYRERSLNFKGLIKFQPYIEGETILAVTDHAALTWSKTFQNVNRRLLTWGTVFAAYPKLRIVHRAGRVHSNVDPISRLRRRVPYQQGPTVDATQHISLDLTEDPLKDMYTELGGNFEEKLLNVASRCVNSLLKFLTTVTPPKMDWNSSSPKENVYYRIIRAYMEDKLYSKILRVSQVDNDKEGNYPQYRI